MLSGFHAPLPWGGVMSCIDIPVPTQEGQVLLDERSKRTGAMCECKT